MNSVYCNGQLALSTLHQESDRVINSVSFSNLDVLVEYLYILGPVETSFICRCRNKLQLQTLSNTQEGHFGHITEAS